MHNLLDALWRDALSYGVFFCLGLITGGRLKQAWKRHLEQQALIADRLDPSTPGGVSYLTALVASMADELDDPERGDEHRD